MTTLVLITDIYPFGSVTENSFITPEIEPLAKCFDRVIIAPHRKLSEKHDVESFPENVEITESLIVEPSLWNKIKGLKGHLKIAYYDWLHSIASPTLRDALAYSAYVGMYRTKIENFIQEENIDINNTLFYTFWFDPATAAFCDMPGVKLITRTHGHDLYETRYFISPWWRRKSFETLLQCHTVSEAGYNYLTAIYPEFEDKIYLNKLGTTATNILNPEKDESTEDSNCGYDLSILGVARVSPEKGVIEQLELLKKYAASHPRKRINYIHIGDGDLMESLKASSAELPPNLTVELKGALHNSEVHKLMATVHFDCLLLLSHSEGGCPIALCEAMSYAIPIVVTAVGGISEMMRYGGGVILPPEPDYSDFEDAMTEIQTINDALRGMAFLTWREMFNAENLRKAFAAQIRKLIDAPGE